MKKVKINYLPHTMGYTEVLQRYVAKIKRFNYRPRSPFYLKELNKNTFSIMQFIVFIVT